MSTKGGKYVYCMDIDGDVVNSAETAQWLESDVIILKNIRGYFYSRVGRTAYCGDIFVVKINGNAPAAAGSIFHLWNIRPLEAGEDGFMPREREAMNKNAIFECLLNRKLP